VLVVGCGSGEDVMRVAKLGAIAHGFDLSAEMLDLAKSLAARENLTATFELMPSEKLTYADNFFDVILMRDILHHVEIPATVAELQRVSKPNALWVINEIYSHTWTYKVRHSRFVDKVLYKKMSKAVYGNITPYITQDERKMTEADMRLATAPISEKLFEAHFYFLVTRLIPEYWHDAWSKVDRAFLKLFRPLGGLLAGRIMIAGRVKK
jgi:ubiquinone/menaquinone biosynthesis C-methylase UbiE